MDAILETVFRTRVVAIVRGLDSGYARLAQALYDGGIRAVEVTFNQKQPDSFAQTAAAIEEIRAAMGSAMYVAPAPSQAWSSCSWHIEPERPLSCRPTQIRT